MTRHADLFKRLEQAELAVKPKRPAIHTRVVIKNAVIDGMEVGDMEVSRAPLPGARWLIAPPIMGLDEWEAIAAPQQDKMVADAMSDINVLVADQQPADPIPMSLRPSRSDKVRR